MATGAGGHIGAVVYMLLTTLSGERGMERERVRERERERERERARECVLYVG